MKLPVSLPDELLLSRLIRYVTASGYKGIALLARSMDQEGVHPSLSYS